MNTSLLARISFTTLALLLAFAPVFASASACPNLYRNLSFGSRGQDVIALQTFLIAEGDLAAGNNTGYFGRMTESAVKSWQAKNGVVSSGTAATTGYGAVGPRTRAKIASVCGGGGNVSANLLSASPTSGGAPLEVSFSSSVPITMFGYYLQYGDGTTNGIECNPGSRSGCMFNVSHIYTNVGTYVVKLIEATKPPVATLATVTITVTGTSAAASRATVTLTSDKTTVTNGGKIRFTSTVRNSGADPLVFFDEKSGQCQSSQFYFMFDGQYSSSFFIGPEGQMLVTAVCSQMTPTIITLQPGQSYSVNHDAEIPPFGNNESVFPYLKNIPTGTHTVNAQVRLWGQGAGVFWEGKSNNLNFNVQ